MSWRKRNYYEFRCSQGGEIVLEGIVSRSPTIGLFGHNEIDGSLCHQLMEVRHVVGFAATSRV